MTYSGDGHTAAHGTPLVSVVIPTHDQARFLSVAIDSVLGQTIGDREVVVVDDGSTDDPAQVVARYPQVRFIRQPNQGLAAARNTGLHHSLGRYLLFLDADDRLLPRAIESGLTCFDANPRAAFVSGTYRFVTADGAPISDSARDPVSDDHYLAFLRGNYVGMHATVLYRRQSLAAAGGFDTRLRACEDYDLYLRLSREYPVAVHDELVAEYRVHGANMSADLPLMLRSVIRALKLQRAHLGGEPARHAAYHAGLRSWREHYTEVLLRRLSNGDYSTVGLGERVRLASTFVHLAPRALLRQGLPVVRRRMSAMVRRRLYRSPGPPPGKQKGAGGREE